MARIAARRGALVVTLLACVSAGSPLRAQTVGDLLARVPSDSQLVLLAPSLDRVSEALATLNTNFAIGDPMMADLPGALAELGIGPGLRSDAPIAVVVSDVDAYITTQTEGLALLLPVSDYATFVGGMGGAPSGGVDALSPRGGPPLHARALEGYALVGFGPMTVAGYNEAPAAPLAGQVTPLHATVIGSGDVTLLVNVSVLEPMLTIGLEEMFAMMTAYGGLSEGLDSMMAGYHAFLTSLVNDTQLVSFGFDTHSAGLSFDLGMSFEAGSVWAGVFSPSGPVGDLLAGVPAGTAMLAAAGNLEGIDITPLLTQLEGIRTGGGMGAMLMDAFGAMEGASAFATAWYATGEPGLSSISVYETDGATYRTHMERSISALNGTEITQLPAGDGTTHSISYTTTWESGVATEEGMTIDRYTTAMVLPPELAADPMLRMSLDPLGTSNVAGLLATSDTLAILMTDRDVSELAGVLRTWSARDGYATTMPRLAALRATALQADFAGEAYFDVGALLSNFGMPMPITAPPLAFFGWTGAGEAAGQMVVPNEIVTLVRTFMELASSMGPI